MGTCARNGRTGLLSRVALGLASLVMAGTAVATDPRASDGGLNELVIYSPGNHPRGLPPIEFRQIRDDMDRLGIDIAPTIHVHRNYYNGNKEYQGPIMVGGPTVVVANHPKTNKRTYIDVNLPPGAPSIAYDRHGITYVYNDQRVRLDFGLLHTEKVHVSYLTGRGMARRAHERGREIADRKAAAQQQQPLRGTVATIKADARATARGLGKVSGQVLNVGAQTVTKVTSVIPGVKALRSMGQPAPGATTRADAIAPGGELPTVATIR